MKAVFYKSIFFVLLFIAIHRDGLSQTYIPLAKFNAHWRVALDYFTSPLPYDEISEYYTGGDTIVNGRYYFKVYKRRLQSVNNDFDAPYVAISDPLLVALIRDDYSERKVYSIQTGATPFTNCPDSTELLLYDFSLNIGDTIDQCIYMNYGDTIQNVYSTTAFGYPTTAFETPVYVNLLEGASVSK